MNLQPSINITIMTVTASPARGPRAGLGAVLRNYHSCRPLRSLRIIFVALSHRDGRIIRRVSSLPPTQVTQPRVPSPGPRPGSQLERIHSVEAVWCSRTLEFMRGGTRAATGRSANQGAAGSLRSIPVVNPGSMRALATSASQQGSQRSLFAAAPGAAQVAGSSTDLRPRAVGAGTGSASATGSSDGDKATGTGADPRALSGSGPVTVDPVAHATSSAGENLVQEASVVSLAHWHWQPEGPGLPASHPSRQDALYEPVSESVVTANAGSKTALAKPQAICRISLSASASFTLGQVPLSSLASPGKHPMLREGLGLILRTWR
jgi:hypothetical protein